MLTTYKWVALFEFQTNHQAPVVQTLDRAIHWINHYPLDNSIGFASVYPLDSDLSGGQRYPSFEQLGPGIHLCIVQNTVICFVFKITPAADVGELAKYATSNKNFNCRREAEIREDENRRVVENEE